MHWADVVAEQLAEQADSHIVATGITPSGPIHVGNMREVLTADLIVRACEDRGLDAELVYIADSADPLRKVYPFLDPDVYSTHVGKPLATIPAPDGEGTYADHFLDPFFSCLDELGIEHRVIDAYQSYADGEYEASVRTACEQRDEIRGLLQRISGRELDADWFPFNPMDDHGRMHGVRVTGYDWPHVEWRNEDGETGRTDISKGGGKLPWRLDWPARWSWIGVTCEPFGKDHSSAGSSWDTAQPLASLFGVEPPLGLPYEWINLKGQGAMSSSAGNAMSGSELLELVPPEIMRFLISRAKPAKHIDFDPGAGLISLADEYERLERRYHAELRGIEQKPVGEGERRERQRMDDARRFELSQVGRGEVSEEDALEMSFSHLSMLCQVKANRQGVFDSLARTHAVDASAPDVRLLERERRMRSWIASDWFPGEVRILLQADVDADWLTGLEQSERDFLSGFAAGLRSTEWNESAIQEHISASIEAAGMTPRTAFPLLYALLLGRPRGPRLAPLIREHDRDAVLSLMSAIGD